MKLYKRLVRAAHKTSTRVTLVHSKFRRVTRRSGHSIFIAAMPKSASTYLVRLIEEATGFIPHSYTYNPHQEQDLYLPRLTDGYGMNTVSHQHTRPSPKNLDLMEKFNIKPVILTRNLPDVIISHKYLLLKDSLNQPSVHAPEEFKSWHEDKQLDFIVDFAGSWCTQFVGQWHEHAKDALWLTYEDVTASPEKALAQVLDYYHISYKDEDIQKAVKVVVNSDKEGHGKKLSKAQLDRLKQFASHYPDAPLDLKTSS